MKLIHQILDLLTYGGLAIAGLSTGGALPPKVGLIAGTVGTVAGKLAQSPNWMPSAEPNEKQAP